VKAGAPPSTLAGAIRSSRSSGRDIANLDEVEPLEQVDQAMDEAGPTDLGASAEGEASADAADEEIGG
jgi:hypothetical protein